MIPALGNEQRFSGMNRCDKLFVIAIAQPRDVITCTMYVHTFIHGRMYGYGVLGLVHTYSVHTFT